VLAGLKITFGDKEEELTFSGSELVFTPRRSGLYKIYLQDTLKTDLFVSGLDDPKNSRLVSPAPYESFVPKQILIFTCDDSSNPLLSGGATVVIYVETEQSTYVVPVIDLKNGSYTAFQSRSDLNPHCRTVFRQLSAVPSFDEAGYMGAKSSKGLSKSVLAFVFIIKSLPLFHQKNYNKVKRFI